MTIDNWKKRASDLYDKFVILNGRKPNKNEIKELLAQIAVSVNTEEKHGCDQFELNQLVDQAMSEI